MSCLSSTLLLHQLVSEQVNISIKVKKYHELNLLILMMMIHLKFLLS
ncbi:unnamed protein product [Spirodela intermedia]|uniref:Uncharacterized protein n=1 Tax=Spirodela intermedia TaxID=51605 RepID=A0A7I8KKP5_SPIIN|nr:unnamed protein product [Spirodela intermedia]